jgi:hypothetical protein
LSDSLQTGGKRESPRKTRRVGKRLSLRQKVVYSLKVFPLFAWQRLTRHIPRGRIHLIVALADHFEPAIVPGDGQARAAYAEQERRLEHWCREYPRVIDPWRDGDGRPFIHTYFYPAEQYDHGLVAAIANHCHGGWGEVEVHLHHGIPVADTAESTRRVLTSFRDALALNHGCLSYSSGEDQPRYIFVHGNFTLANSAQGFACGVDSELQILAETGCFADMTMPTNPFHRSQRAKINSLYECTPPLQERAAYRRGRDLARGRTPVKFPLIVQGPLMPDFSFPRSGRPLIDNGAFSALNSPSLRRLENWKRAAVRVQGRPDWLFIKLHCHGMDPTQHDAVMGDAFRSFLRRTVEGASERGETLHFVSAREMVNIILAACDGHEGNPGDFRNYRFRVGKRPAARGRADAASQVALRG